LENTGDGQVDRAVVLDEVVLGVLKGTLALTSGRVLAEPDEDLRSGIKDERVSSVQLGTGNVTLSHKRELEATRGIRQAEELLGEVAATGDLVVTALGGRLDGLLATEVLPELSETGVTLSEDLNLNLTTTLVIKGASKLSRLRALADADSLTHPLNDLQAQVEDEGITRVQGIGGELDLMDTDGLGGTLDVKETRLVLLGLHMLESGVNATVKDADARGSEVRGETLALIAINLAVLDGSTTEEVVELDGLVSLRNQMTPS
jgi:hypothetical protein